MRIATIEYARPRRILYQEPAPCPFTRNSTADLLPLHLVFRLFLGQSDLRMVKSRTVPLVNNLLDALICDDLTNTAWLIEHLEQRELVTSETQPDPLTSSRLDHC